jgi:hypothetical protein
LSIHSVMSWSSREGPGRGGLCFCGLNRVVEVNQIELTVRPRLEDRDGQPKMGGGRGDEAGSMKEVGGFADKLAGTEVIGGDVVLSETDVSESVAGQVEQGQIGHLNMVYRPWKERKRALRLTCGHAVELGNTRLARLGQVQGRDQVWRVPPAAEHPSAFTGQRIPTRSGVAEGEAGPGMEAEPVDRLEQFCG